MGMMERLVAAVAAGHDTVQKLAEFFGKASEQVRHAALYPALAQGRIKLVKCGQYSYRYEVVR